MIRHVNNPGERNWFTDHLVELQSESLKAVDAVASILGAYVISGCEYSTVGGNTVISAGIVCLRVGTDYKIMPFDGVTITEWETAHYLVPVVTPIAGTYENPIDTTIANDIRAEVTTTAPSGTSGVDYFGDVIDGMPSFWSRLYALILANNYILPTEANKTYWNAKLDNTEVTTTPTANKVLRLNSSLKLQASITGDAATLNSKTAATIITDARAATQCTITENTVSTIKGGIYVIGKVMHFSLWVDITAEAGKIFIIDDYAELGFVAAKIGLVVSNEYGDCSIKCSISSGGIVTIPSGQSVDGWISGIIVAP